MQDNIYSVSEVNNYIKQLLEQEDELRNIQVAGEISNFKRYPSGHCYFTLKDSGAVLKCVMFRFRAASLRFEPHNGDKVVGIGRIAVYERDGVYQLYVDLLLQQGVGNLMQQYEKLKAKLLAAGLFDAERKQALPVNPQRVGIITSQAGAAVRDIISVSRRRNPGIKLYLYPVQVQGEAASVEIAAALDFFNKQNLADVLIVGRGGGSIEDLWAFNEERTVRAVAASHIPVISAVGHETDFTLCDFAADVRAATPSQAAELAVADIAGYAQQVQHLMERSEQLLRHRVELAEQKVARLTHSWALQEPQRIFAEMELRLERLTHSWALQEPERIFAEKELRLDRAQQKLVQALEGKLQRGEHALALAAAKLDSLSPLAVLSRGYSVTRSAQQKLVGSVADVAWGDEIITSLADGDVVSVVQSTERREN